MRISREWIWVGVLAMLAALVSYGPVLAADYLAPSGQVFSGFLLNPIDGHTYLAKMHQGFEGLWQFRLDYSPQPGQEVFLYSFYLALGQIGRVLGIELLDLFHTARLAAVILMFMVSYHFFNRFTPTRPARWLAFGLALIGGGLGWLGLVFGVEGSDLFIPESVPFLAGYVNAHFPLAISLFLISTLLVLTDDRRLGRRSMMAAGCGAALALLLPFSCFSLVLALASWLAWEAMINVREHGWRMWVKTNRSRLVTALALLSGMAPILAYDGWVVRQHPVISEWTLQNLTPSPPLSSYMFGYGLILIMAIASLKIVLDTRRLGHRFLAAWMVSGLISLYLPIGLQRRLNLGLFYPMASLAVLAWDRWCSGRRWGNLLAVLILALSLPSNLIVIGAGLASASTGEPLVTYAAAEEPAYEWIADSLPQNVLILSSPQVGNRLPAYTSARVLYGHPFETPQAESQRELVENLLSYSGPPAAGLQELLAQDVEYVFFGPAEENMGDPSWLSLLDPVYQRAGVTIYEVSPP